MSPGPVRAPGIPPGRALLAVVLSTEAGSRLDRWLAGRLPDVSRSKIRQAVDAGLVRVNGRRLKAGHRLKAGERVEARIPEPPPEAMTPEPIALTVVFEDDQVLVVDKPAGMVTHPGAGQRTGTLAAAALARAPEMAGVGGPGRPGVVHRLDKGTSGLIVLARTAGAYERLTAELARRGVGRRYLCLVHGRLRRAEGTIDAPIGRDPGSRTRMAVVAPGRGKRAVTRFRVLERFAGATLVECRLETGRTHQIRVHLASLGHPLLGDEAYGRRHARDDRGLGELIATLGGVALHAAGLAFTHPTSGARLDLSSPLPPRIERILAYLRARGA
jgi:23S rRNA pseudouridine1911/1915/1917 synthase